MFGTGFWITFAFIIMLNIILDFELIIKYKDKHKDDEEQKDFKYYIYMIVLDSIDLLICVIKIVSKNPAISESAFIDTCIFAVLAAKIFFFIKRYF